MNEARKTGAAVIHMVGFAVAAISWDFFQGYASAAGFAFGCLISLSGLIYCTGSDES